MKSFFIAKLHDLKNYGYYSNFIGTNNSIEKQILYEIISDFLSVIAWACDSCHNYGQ